MSHYILIELPDQQTKPDPANLTFLLGNMLATFNVKSKVTVETDKSLERFAIEPEDGPDEGDDTPIKL